jgi:hypothetical protein
MRLPLRDLQEAARNPTAYKKRLAAGAKGGGGFWYFSVLRLAAFEYHKSSDPEQAVAYLKTMCGRHRKRLSDEPRITRMEAQLRWYCTAYEGQTGRQFAVRRRVAVKLPTGALDDVRCSGEVARCDLTPSGEYRAWLFREHSDPDWKDDLQMPLIQEALARELGVIPASVGVGVINFAEASSDWVVFNDARIHRARRQLGDLLSQLGLVRIGTDAK